MLRLHYPGAQTDGPKRTIQVCSITLRHSAIKLEAHYKQDTWVPPNLLHMNLLNQNSMGVQLFPVRSSHWLARPASQTGGWRPHRQMGGV